jgi:uncharacterized protein
MADEFRRPLRRRRIADHLKALRPSPLAAASLTVMAAGIGLAVWLFTSPHPLDDGPVVRVSIAMPDPMITASIAPSGDPPEASDRLNSVLALPTPRDIATDEAPAGQAAEIMDPRRRPLVPAPVEAVSEAGPFGPLPRIASDGSRPFDVYAQAIPASVLNSGNPKIVVVLGGMGLNAQLTRQAIRDLPGTVTLAFAPYGDSVQTLADEARAGGHEVMLHLPMEPFGYPGVDPGPRTLRAGEAASDNLDRLAWLLSRFAGYVGVVNYMGARLSGDEAALRAVLAEIGRRGLVYVDDGSSPRSLAHRLGGEVGLPVRRARVIDAGATMNEVRSSLDALEAEAHLSGLAIGIGTGLPTTIDAVRIWARDLAGRGVVLVPASASYRIGATADAQD